MDKVRTRSRDAPLYYSILIVPFQQICEREVIWVSRDDLHGAAVSEWDDPGARYGILEFTRQQRRGK